MIKKLRALSQAEILFWAGFGLMTTGFYVWLGAAGALIFAGAWLSSLGILTDLVQGKQIASAQRTGLAMTGGKTGKETNK